jgi:leucyl-tRNA synthetase
VKAYDHKKIESKWQKEWDKNKIYQAVDPSKSKKPKYYSLIEFPYPSGDGLHVGHPRPYIGMDVISRKKRMEGYNVLYPIGWDAFGLPTENYAIKTKQDPRVVTAKNIKNFTKQIKSLGISFDWAREVNTTDPKYYKWTQWIFLQFLKKGLAYKAKIAINWCPIDKIGLANEEVINGCCERCGSPVEKREKEQWMLRITKYAERLDKDLDTVDFLPHIKLAQKNWIGKSEGAEINFKITGGEEIKVFTTRPDTIYGATYLVLAPDHPILSKIKNTITNWGDVQMYQLATKAKNELERTREEKDKSGVELKGIQAINPATGEDISVWIADYVLANYGTGAIMAVPAHDERDLAFAQKFNLPVVEVVTSEGILKNSGRFDGLKAIESKKKITDFAGGEMVTKFKLRDWIFSRQRYWGEPIPVIHCAKCGIVPVPEKDLPVELPKVKNYEPTDSGESPLAKITKWVNVKCPNCKGEAKRETDTMPNWAGSSWYYLRYTDPDNAKAFADKKNLEYFTPVDWYNGGNEHTTLHLLYSRFWHKFLFDLGLVPTSEPYMKRTSHGFILAQNGEKMSKSRGNVVNPDDIVNRFGADTMRMYEMFMGPFDQAIAWSEDGLLGPRRFLERVWVRATQLHENSSTSASLNKLIKKVSDDIESMKFNTAISSLMIFVNENESMPKEVFEIFLKLLAPFAPHIAEEIWEVLGNKNSINLSPWPVYDAEKIKEEKVKIVIQVNGKLRGELYVKADATEMEVSKEVESMQEISKYFEGKAPKKVIYVKGRLINIVV